jgi:septal ring-binding cell division protein DamX
MRFEIRAGGAFLILIGLAGLSGVVFALGLVAGYQMARQTSSDTSQVASVYPLPNPPPASEPSQAPSPAEAKAAPSPAVAPPPAQVAAKPPVKPAPAPAAASSVAAAPAPQPAPARKVAKAVAPPAPIPKPAEENTETGGAIDQGSQHAAVASAPVRHKPYNIQIDAVMDRTNAQNMAAKLQRLGYRAYLVPTEIGDQTWWRVRIGPYDTQEEAAAAEQELRARYRTSYPRQ